ncbi:MAG TPA: glycoside hydrolase family 2 TIM barrel-domain containing protein [Candidatus Sulfotelmatobacter sp.]
MGAVTSASVMPVASPRDVRPTHCVSLDGIWHFRLDRENVGDTLNWQRPGIGSDGWTKVTVPHTWQITQDSAEYFGTAWYRRTFDVPQKWSGQAVRIQFEAVFHSATVWINGVEVGKHLRKGYTAFTLDISFLLRPNAENLLVVKVNSSFDQEMLPRGHSSDWTPDGGIYRPVSLLVTPEVYIERVDVDAIPDLVTGSADLDISAVIRNTGHRGFEGKIECEAIEESTGLTAMRRPNAARVTIPAGEAVTVHLQQTTIANAKLWHFDSPNLYSLVIGLEGPGSNHQYAAKFGIRSIEIKDGSFYFNGERVRLMGVERMAGSNPEFGMAEPTSWIDHDHDDMKELNCVFTRVHWPQDKRILEYCDRHGILIQTEVPAWGGATFDGMREEPTPAIMQNGLEQLREMILRDRNHPSIFSWGLCNEVGGQNPPAYKFAKRMYEEAKQLDPRRLRSYASNSLQTNLSADASVLMDFVEWNEYYEVWFDGTLDELRSHFEEIHRAFPGKPIVISEYGYCACTPDRLEGDARRIEILRNHTNIFREKDYIGGVIFFCYNDYRTHVGDRGSGAMKQRIHGVVDVLGARKPSYLALRDESSPVETLECKGSPSALVVSMRTRKSIPSYPLAGYKLRGILYGYSGTPLEQCEASLPLFAPGQSVSVTLRFKEQTPVRIKLDVIRPTGFSTVTKVWKP